MRSGFAGDVEKLFFVLLLGVAATTTTFAWTTPPHVFDGVVRKVDGERRIIAVEASKDSAMVDFSVPSDRTRFRLNGRQANLLKLVPGQRVKLNYRREPGKNVAVEVNWRAPIASVADPDSSLQR